MSQRNTDRSSLQESHPSEDSGVSLRDARRWGGVMSLLILGIVALMVAGILWLVLK